MPNGEQSGGKWRRVARYVEAILIRFRNVDLSAFSLQTVKREFEGLSLISNC